MEKNFLDFKNCIIISLKLFQNVNKDELAEVVHIFDNVRVLARIGVNFELMIIQCITYLNNPYIVVDFFR